MALGAIEPLAAKPFRARVDPALIKAAVDESGLTYRAISDKAGVAEKTVSRWVSGESGMNPMLWPAFLVALGLPEKRRAALLKAAGQQ